MELRSGAVTGQGIMPPAYRPYFEEGARIVFQRWTALNLAVENQWGGPTSAEKAQQIYNECIAWFYASKEHYEDDLEEEFLDVLSQVRCQTRCPVPAIRLLGLSELRSM